MKVIDVNTPIKLELTALGVKLLEESQQDIEISEDNRVTMPIHKIIKTFGSHITFAQNEESPFYASAELPAEKLSFRTDCPAKVGLKKKGLEILNRLNADKMEAADERGTRAILYTFDDYGFITMPMAQIMLMFASSADEFAGNKAIHYAFNIEEKEFIPIADTMQL